MQKERKFSIELSPAKAGPEFVEIRYVRGWENSWFVNLRKKDRNTGKIIDSIRKKGGTYESESKLSFLSRMVLKWFWSGRNPQFHGTIGSGDDSDGKISFYTYTDKTNSECVWLEGLRDEHRSAPIVACTLESTLQFLEELQSISKRRTQ